MDKLKEVKKIIQMMNEGSVTTQDLQTFITATLEFVKKQKDDFLQISQDSIDEVDKIVLYIEKEHEKTLQKVDEKSSKLEQELTKQIKEVKYLLEGAKNLIPQDGRDGLNGKDGKDGSPDTPEEIVKKINTLESVIERKTIKGLDNLVDQPGLDRALGILDQRTQYLINKTVVQPNLAGYVPTTRTLTINGVTQDLSTNRTWTVAVPTLTSQLTNDSGFITSSSLTGYLQNNVGIAGGTTLIGGTASGNNLTLSSTSHATKGKILFGNSAYNEVNNRLGIGTTTPSSLLDVGTYNSSLYTIKTGGFVIQPHGMNNGSISDNCYYNGTSWTKILSGYSSGFQFFNGQLLVNNASSGSGVFSQIIPLKTDFSNGGTVTLGGNVANALSSYTGAVMIVVGTGRVGIGNMSPSARLHLAAGTAVAGTAPLKLTSGTNMTTPEDGTFEYDGTNLYFTVGSTRKTVTLV